MRNLVVTLLIAGCSSTTDAERLDAVAKSGPFADTTPSDFRRDYAVVSEGNTKWKGKGIRFIEATLTGEPQQRASGEILVIFHRWHQDSEAADVACLWKDGSELRAIMNLSGLEMKITGAVKGWDEGIAIPIVVGCRLLQ